MERDEEDGRTMNNFTELAIGGAKNLQVQCSITNKMNALNSLHFQFNNFPKLPPTR